jgi:hypothetical protein
METKKFSAFLPSEKVEDYTLCSRLINWVWLIYLKLLSKNLIIMKSNLTKIKKRKKISTDKSDIQFYQDDLNPNLKLNFCRWHQHYMIKRDLQPQKTCQIENFLKIFINKLRCGQNLTKNITLTIFLQILDMYLRVFWEFCFTK